MTLCLWVFEPRIILLMFMIFHCFQIIFNLQELLAGVSTQWCLSSEVLSTCALALFERIVVTLTCADLVHHLAVLATRC